MDLLPDRLPWYIAGPALGALVVGLFVVANQPLGASGAYLHTTKLLRGEPDAAGWRAYYLVGIVLGGLLATVLGPGVDVRAGYDTLTGYLTTPVTVGVVFVAAIVMGYGARMAGGCTSGHGICGTAQRSLASWVTTATFMATAIVATNVVRWVTGGEL